MVAHSTPIEPFYFGVHLRLDTHVVADVIPLLHHAEHLFFLVLLLVMGGVVSEALMLAADILELTEDKLFLLGCLNRVLLVILLDDGRDLLESLVDLVGVLAH